MLESTSEESNTTTMTVTTTETTQPPTNSPVIFEENGQTVYIMQKQVQSVIMTAIADVVHITLYEALAMGLETCKNVYNMI